MVSVNGYRNSSAWERDASMAMRCAVPVHATTHSLYDAQQYLLPPFLWELLEFMKRMPQYEYIGVLDDDAYFVDPEEAVGLMLDAFYATPKLGQTGPMGGLRKSWRYLGTPDLVEFVKASPWTTLGCQIYRREALLSLGDISWLNRLYFRADSLIALALHMHGWHIGEQDLRFSHEMSAGLSGPTHSPETHARMLTMGENDWRVYFEVLAQYYQELGGYIANGGTVVHPYSWYCDQVQAVAAAHRRTHSPHKKNHVTKRS
jgi:hypothetical protein